VDHLGNPAHTQVFTDGQAYAATQVLKGVIAQGTGTAANYGCPAAGKTGTAENLANAWFVGYTPKLSTAVWVGYPGGNVPMANGFGGTLAAPIWHDYMAQASDGYCGDFPVPNQSFQGTPFFGQFATTGSSSQGSGNSSGSGFQGSPSTGGAGVGTARHGHLPGSGRGTQLPPGFGTGHLPGVSGGGAASPGHRHR
jgi:penicillin-binding protein 1A